MKTKPNSQGIIDHDPECPVWLQVTDAWLEDPSIRYVTRYVLIGSKHTLLDFVILESGRRVYSL